MATLRDDCGLLAVGRKVGEVAAAVENTVLGDTAVAVSAFVDACVSLGLWEKLKLKPRPASLEELALQIGGGEEI